MARVTWSDRALADLDEIASYIDLFNPAAATNIKDRLFALGESLAYAPERGRPTSGGARELVSVRPYILRYRIDGKAVLIVRIRHSGRRSLR